MAHVCWSVRNAPISNLKKSLKDLTRLPPQRFLIRLYFYSNINELSFLLKTYWILIQPILIQVQKVNCINTNLCTVAYAALPYFFFRGLMDESCNSFDEHWSCEDKNMPPHTKCSSSVTERFLSIQHFWADEDYGGSVNNCQVPRAAGVDFSESCQMAYFCL